MNYFGCVVGMREGNVVYLDLVGNTWGKDTTVGS